MAPCTAYETNDADAAHGTVADGYGAHHAAASWKPPTATGTDRLYWQNLLSEVHDLQQQLAAVNTGLLLGVSDAANVIRQHLGVELAAIWAFTSAGGHGAPLAACLAASGAGAELLQGEALTADVASAPLCAYSAPGPLLFASSPGAASLPQDLAQLRRAAGLRCFCVVPLGAPGARKGALLLAASAAGKMAQEGWGLYMHALPASLLPHLRSHKVERMCHLLASMAALEDPAAVIGMLLRSASRYMRRSSSLRASARFALLPPAGIAVGQALLFECPPGASEAGAVGLAASGGEGQSAMLAHPGDVTGEVVASQMGLSNTLLGAAVVREQARFIRDISAYCRSCAHPARDIFTTISPSLVSSIIVIPIIEPSALVANRGGGAPAPGRDRALGGLFFAMESPTEFEHLQATLLDFVYGVSPLLFKKLGDAYDQLAADLARMPPRGPASTAAPSSVVSSDPPSCARSPGTTTVSSTAPGASPPAPYTPGAAGPCTSLETTGGAAVTTTAGGRGMVRLGSQATLTWVPPGHTRLNVEAMFKLVQSELHGGRFRAAELASAVELTLGRQLGAGGFGIVYKARWLRSVVAAKVMDARSCERAALKDATEMAILSALKHPNIVQAYTCITNALEFSDDGTGSTVGSSTLSASGGDAPVRRFRRLAPEEDPDDTLPLVNILVMEYCDQGTLRDAVRGGALHTRLPDGSVGVDTASVVDILTEVAAAVGFLHSMGVVHGDIKLDNVLLKSDPSRQPLGVVPKLSDFGMACLLDSNSRSAVNHSGGGTVTHLAPEMFVPQSKITTGVDAYAFGIFMYELYTGRRAYTGLPAAAISEKVLRGGLRPRFPAGTPPALAGLAADCWAADPSARPAFDGPGGVAERLDAMAAGLAAAVQRRPRAACTVGTRINAPRDTRTAPSVAAF